MAFVDVGYIITVLCCLTALFFVPHDRKQYLWAVLVAANLLLVLHSIFMVRQVAGILQIARKAANQLGLPSTPIPYQLDGFTLRLALIVLLPVLFWFRQWRSNLWLSLLLVYLLLDMHPVSLWYATGFTFKIMNWLCLLCAAYALLWLRKRLPWQKEQVS